MAALEAYRWLCQCSHNLNSQLAEQSTETLRVTRYISLQVRARARARVRVRVSIEG